MRKTSQLIVLVGPKGAGKSTVGRALDNLGHATFLSAEPISKRVFDRFGRELSEDYVRAACLAVLDELVALAPSHPCLVVETTGAFPLVHWYLDELRAHFDVRLVRLSASFETCDARIEARDAGIHIPVAPEVVREMHYRSIALSLPWDCVVDNDGTSSPVEVARAILACVSAPKNA